MNKTHFQSKLSFIFKFSIKALQNFVFEFKKIQLSKIFSLISVCLQFYSPPLSFLLSFICLCLIKEKFSQYNNNMIIISSGIDSWIFCQDTQETLVCKYASKQHVNTTKELNRKKQLVTEETCCFIFYCIDQLSDTQKVMVLF